MGQIICGPLPEAPTRAAGCQKFVDYKMFDSNLGFVLSKIENSEKILSEFASFKANYQVNGRGDRSLSTVGVT